MSDLEFEQRRVADAWSRIIEEEIRHTESGYKVKEGNIEDYQKREEELREEERFLEGRYKELRCQEVTGMSADQFYHQTVEDMTKRDMQAIEDAKAEKIAALEKENQAEDSLQL
ncbi:MAG: hypothetical protein E7048_07455 [Lentisphaerae bacterium]|nr:hypothetical protein [Lentisphaerota bacterium]